MDLNIHGAFVILFLLLHLTPINATTIHITSNSILVALLDSHYTHLSELVEKALLLQTLEQTLSHHNITIFAPTNQALEQHLHPEFKHFLLQPGNIKSLQNLLLFHIVPFRVGSKYPELLLHTVHTHYETLCVDENDNRLHFGSVKLTRPDDIIRPDGLIHGIDRLLVPELVQQEFNRRRSLSSISAVLPEGAPVVDPRTNRLKKPAALVPTGAPIPVYEASGPGLAPAPAPGPGGSRHYFDGATQVKDFIQTLIHYGGYNELADILVNLTSLATEMGKLVSEGYVLTVLAPNDEAMAKLTTEQLSDSGAPERIMYYHMIPEYQTEESMYNSVRRFGKVEYDTLRLPEKVVAEEADGSVKFGSGEESAYLFDPDIYTDGRISVQGIDGVLFPVAETVEKMVVDVAPAKAVVKQNRGKLLEVACSIVDAFGQASQFTSCY
ncbi:hypothetical protein QVD17_11503 [Tagetes erecta]|uniref:FAS1 domain-containing protein n=1 Tax=Tagetes erecta TaxID=13708 RepID=A0AAD8KZQ5_TARER|nr:hypothetical protein QVD17_11503 [Tagetes erecta]